MHRILRTAAAAIAAAVIVPSAAQGATLQVRRRLCAR